MNDKHISLTTHNFGFWWSKKSTRQTDKKEEHNLCKRSQRQKTGDEQCDDAMRSAPGSRTYHLTLIDGHRHGGALKTSLILLTLILTACPSRGTIANVTNKTSSFIVAEDKVLDSVSNKNVENITLTNIISPINVPPKMTTSPPTKLSIDSKALPITSKVSPSSFSSPLPSSSLLLTSSLIKPTVELPPTVYNKVNKTTSSTASLPHILSTSAFAAIVNVGGRASSPLTTTTTTTTTVLPFSMQATTTQQPPPITDNNNISLSSNKFIDAGDVVGNVSTHNVNSAFNRTKLSESKTKHVDGDRSMLSAHDDHNYDLNEHNHTEEEHLEEPSNKCEVSVASSFNKQLRH